MAVIIKEMRVRTVVEKKVVTLTDISEDVCRYIQDRVIEQLSVSSSKYPEIYKKRKER